MREMTVGICSGVQRKKKERKKATPVLGIHPRTKRSEVAGRRDMADMHTPNELS
jgi:hypothetical protein